MPCHHVANPTIVLHVNILRPRRYLHTVAEVIARFGNHRRSSRSSSSTSSTPTPYPASSIIFIMEWLTSILICIAASVSVMWSRQLLRKARPDLAQITSTMGDQADIHFMQRGFAMAEMLHYLSVVFLLIGLVVFLYIANRAAAISLVILFLVARLRR